MSETSVSSGEFSGRVLEPKQVPREGWSQPRKDAESGSTTTGTEYDPKELGTMSDVASTVSEDSDDVEYSSAAEGDLDPNAEKCSSAGDDGDDRRLLPDSDFRLPETIKIPSVGDKFKENLVAVCYPGEVVSPSEFYLTLLTGLSDMDVFIEFMSDIYHKWSREPGNTKWMLNGKGKLVQPGGYVACFNPASDARQTNEIVRAKIIREVSKGDMEKYDVFLIDTGEFHVVGIWDMLFLYEAFILPPSFSIKCRLNLDPSYASYHGGLKQWKIETTNLLMNVVKSRELTVRFVRQVTQENGERIWEVSITNLNPRHRDIRRGELVEKKVIEKTLRFYDDNKAGKGK